MHSPHTVTIFFIAAGLALVVVGILGIFAFEWSHLMSYVVIGFGVFLILTAVILQMVKTRRETREYYEEAKMRGAVERLDKRLKEQYTVPKKHYIAYREPTTELSQEAIDAEWKRKQAEKRHILGMS